MKYIVVTSDTPYFHWQLLVQYNNFKKMGIEKDLIWLVSFDDKISDQMILMTHMLKIPIILRKDLRKSRIYVSSVRPHIFHKLLLDRPELENEVFFLLDPDVLFTKKPNFDHLINDNIWYLSDTTSYLDSNYIKSKGEELFIEMCNIVDIDPKIVEANDENAGGAQVIMKNINSEYWNKVYHDSEKLYEHMIRTKNKYNPKHPIQAWTADMWAILWNAWYFGHETKIHKDLDFSWATDFYTVVERKNIFHNAGVFDQIDLFNKNKFSHAHPFYQDFSYINNERGSSIYVNEIIDTLKNYEKIIERLV